MHTAIVLIAHGSRRAEANDELRELSRRIGKSRPECLVVPAFLELAEPTIPAALQACLEQGAREVLMFPYFLSAGMHVTRDLEGQRLEFGAAHPDVSFRLLRPLGAHPRVVDIVQELLDEPAGPTRNAPAAVDERVAVQDQSE